MSEPRPINVVFVFQPVTRYFYADTGEEVEDAEDITDCQIYGDGKGGTTAQIEWDGAFSVHPVAFMGASDEARKKGVKFDLGPPATQREGV